MFKKKADAKASPPCGDSTYPAFDEEAPAPTAAGRTHTTKEISLKISKEGTEGKEGTEMKEMKEMKAGEKRLLTDYLGVWPAAGRTFFLVAATALVLLFGFLSVSVFLLFCTAFVMLNGKTPIVTPVHHEAPPPPPYHPSPPVRTHFSERAHGQRSATTDIAYSVGVESMRRLARAGQVFELSYVSDVTHKTHRIVVHEKDMKELTSAAVDIHSVPSQSAS
ncbi:unnamed protein product [Vitrella brassicaformis CCMP3155]|uniref:Uncharacterized protein n=1 Tax=Vitrella brassicaformis (strain CCMP3155) TaxID=1169540 RepID=A0A0G4GRV4_VITBC|nr:unnamed protein product [Vitrella brassicaformis CCMP3155]|eukprot:CEM33355.1 unnamed protein product [Vitrella brassicaformis CCMP3155]